MLVVMLFPGRSYSYAEIKNGVVWEIDSCLFVNPVFSSFINEGSPKHPDPAQYTCVWVMGWMNIPENVYYSLNYRGIYCDTIPDGVILETIPAVQDQNKPRTVSEDGTICDQIGVIVYIERTYDVAERLDLLFSSQNLFIQINDQVTNDTLTVFPTFTHNQSFESIPSLDITTDERKAKTIIQSISPVTEDMAVRHEFHDLLRYIDDGYQCWIVRFCVISDMEHPPMKSFFVQTRERDESFILSKGEYAFLGSFMQGNHIKNGCVDAFLITKPTTGDESITIIENMLLDDELTLYLSPTNILLANGLFELNTPWAFCAPLRSNDGNWNPWQ
ncbi:MAG: hypothetical protein J6K72_01520 [Clostridia bacterium]|nr:hypothetical protein [Clostridia bacterium]